MSWTKTIRITAKEWGRSKIEEPELWFLGLLYKPCVTHIHSHTPFRLEYERKGSFQVPFVKIPIWDLWPPNTEYINLRFTQLFSSLQKCPPHYQCQKFGYKLGIYDYEKLTTKFSVWKTLTLSIPPGLEKYLRTFYLVHMEHTGPFPKWRIHLFIVSRSKY